MAVRSVRFSDGSDMPIDPKAIDWSIMLLSLSIVVMMKLPVPPLLNGLNKESIVILRTDDAYS